MRYKALFLATALLLACALLLSGCAGKFVCPMCGQEKSGKGESVTINGESFKVCKECKEKIQSAGGLMGMTLDALGGDLSSMQDMLGNTGSLDSLNDLLGSIGN